LLSGSIDRLSSNQAAASSSWPAPWNKAPSAFSIATSPGRAAAACAPAAGRRHVALQVRGDADQVGALAYDALAALDLRELGQRLFGAPGRHQADGQQRAHLVVAGIRLELAAENLDGRLEIAGTDAGDARQRRCRGSPPSARAGPSASSARSGECRPRRVCASSLRAGMLPGSLAMARSR
jgi:hypothetical protein